MRSAGLAIGIMVGLIIAVILLKVSNRDKKTMTEYDERQKAIRGKAYMFGFYGIAISNVIMLVLGIDNMDYIKMLGMNAFFTPILVGILVQVSYSIFNDSYYGLNNNVGRYTVIMTIVSAINIAAGVLEWVHGGFIQNGAVYNAFINLEVGVLFIVICIELFIKKAIDKKQDAE